jgi:D-inositol-3-phosphate glycosyltransferase
MSKLLEAFNDRMPRRSLSRTGVLPIQGSSVKEKDGIRVCHLLTNFLPRQGGAEYAAHFLAKYLAKAGIESVVQAAWMPDLPVVSNLPYEIHRYRYLPLVSSEFSKRVHLAVERRRRGFDILHAHMAYEPGYWGALHRARTGIPLVVTVHGGDVQVVPEIGYGARLRPGVEPKLRIGLANADVVGCVSQRIRQLVIECGGAPERADVIPNGTEFYEFERVPYENYRERYGIAPDELVAISVGRMHPVKGISYLLDAAVILKSRGLRFRCLIVGADNQVSEAARARDIQDVIVAIPPVPQHTPETAGVLFDTPYAELVNLYRAADVCVVPSYMESFSMAAADAMAIGIPCIVTNTTGIAEWLEDGVSGLVIERSSVDAIVGAVQRLYDDRQQMRDMGAAARKIAETFDWGRVADRYAAHYERLIGQRHAGRREDRRMIDAVDLR